MTGTPSAGRGMRVRRASSRVSALLPVAATFVLLASPPRATADVMPPERLTNWNPGIPGGIPNYTTVCTTVNASDYGNGAIDATAGIQAAINGCPNGQVVKLSAGIFQVNGANPITIEKSIVLRGAGPLATKLLKTNGIANPLILIGRRWLEEAGSVNLTANASKGATSVQVTSTAGFSVGQLVLVDEITDDSYVYWGTNCPPGAPCRGWFTRFDRPVGQMLEIASISGNTVSFTTALHISLDTAHTAQLTRWTIPYGAKYAGIEDLYVRGGQDDNITLRFAMYSWVRGVESDWSVGDSFALDTSFRCVLRDSYAHDTPNPFPGGARLHALDRRIHGGQPGGEQHLHQGQQGHGDARLRRRQRDRLQLLRRRLHRELPGLDGDGAERVAHDLSPLRAVRGQPGLQHRRRRHLGRGGLQHLLPQPHHRQAAVVSRHQTAGAPSG